MQNKSVISLISYDAEYLPESISRYYDYVDEIILGLDKDRITWSRNSFSFDEEALWAELSKIDGDNKIVVVEEDFHQSNVAIENDNYERNFLKSFCSHDLVLSIDADEHLLNAKTFFNNYCPIVEKYTNKLDVCMTWATPYKIIGDTALVICNLDGSPFFGENQGFMSNRNSTYVYARWTELSARGGNRVISPLIALHWSLCREEDKLRQKVHNIGHSDIAEKDPFFNVWKSVTLENYSNYRNFKTSGLGTAQWPALRPVKVTDLEHYYLDFAESVL